jgi:hypothetical protein
MDGRRQLLYFGAVMAIVGMLMVMPSLLIVSNAPQEADGDDLPSPPWQEPFDSSGLGENHYSGTVFGYALFLGLALILIGVSMIGYVRLSVIRSRKT